MSAPNGAVASRPAVLLGGLDLGWPATLSLVTDGVCDVHAAQDTSRFFRLAAKYRPRLALIDLSAPRMEGLRTIRVLARAQPGCGVVVMTTEAAAVNGAEDAAIAAVFVKPVECAPLLDRLEALLELRTRRPVGLPRFHPPVSRALTHIASNFGRPIPRHALADAAWSSPSHLAQQFRLQTGRTISEFLRQVRFRVAQYVFETSDHTLKEVATIAGLSDASHVSRVFLDYAACRPGAYRRECLRQMTDGGG